MCNLIRSGRLHAPQFAQFTLWIPYLNKCIFFRFGFKIDVPNFVGMSGLWKDPRAHFRLRVVGQEIQSGRFLLETFTRPSVEVGVPSARWPCPSAWLNGGEEEEEATILRLPNQSCTHNLLLQTWLYKTRCSHHILRRVWMTTGDPWVSAVEGRWVILQWHLRPRKTAQITPTIQTTRIQIRSRPAATTWPTTTTTIRQSTHSTRCTGMQPRQQPWFTGVILLTDHTIIITNMEDIHPHPRLITINKFWTIRTQLIQIIIIMLQILGRCRCRFLIGIGSPHSDMTTEDWLMTMATSTLTCDLDFL